ncbi:MFS transporter [Roseateles sp. BYS180W]|uniref:MFS transporter n=1 Tax=Roseateles rivi TaxID=3299028 RepID=A0ABW7FS20_9BURK
MTTPTAPALPWRLGAGYGLLAAPLAFASLPLYVLLPHHYAQVYGAPLAALGLVLLGTRVADALIDPALGRLVDRWLRSGSRQALAAASLAAVLMALAFAALWWPPRAPAALAGTPWLLGWLALTLLLCTLAYSGLSILHLAWAARWGGLPAWRARVGAWREGLALGGVVLASVLPTLAGLALTCAVLAALLLAGLLALRTLPANPLSQALNHAELTAEPPATDAATPSAAAPAVWRNPAFLRLLAVHLCNGVAAATAATLLPFFVADRLQTPTLQPLFLLGYFAAAALALPLWVRVVARLGLAPSWRLGMVLAVLAFAPTPWLTEGDAWAFLAVCLLSGAALGADLALPGALLTGVIHHAGAQRQAEGVYLGWWTCATKLNLALAAGLALPLLAALGYEAGTRSSAGLQALAWAYGGLPVLLKLCAWALLRRSEHHHPTWSALS